MRDDPHRPAERTAAARALLADPWRPAEADPSLFALIRRHAEVLDRWFTQRLGYRLVVNVDTARLTKSGHVPSDRPLRTHTGRAFTGREYVALALVLAATAAGPDRISLRDLVLQVRSAAADAGITLDGGPAERRSLVTALRWLIGRGVVRELDRSVAGYETDGRADALLEIRNDRLTMLHTPALVGAESAEELVERSTEPAGRAALRRRLVEDPVLYAEDVTAEEWAELRRRTGEEVRFLDEMFGLRIEARAEGVAAIDVDGGLSDVPFPRSGTVSHLALLLLAVLTERHRDGADPADLDHEIGQLIERYGRFWRKDAIADPSGLCREAVELLRSMRLVAVDSAGCVRPRPAAARFTPDVVVAGTDDDPPMLAL
ncbi:MAG: TIGR02678 family protein [Pseudonocardia sp.]